VIERDSFDRDVFNVTCDDCGDDVDIDSGGDWSDMIALLKGEEGWLIRKDGDDWTHLCPSCRLKTSQ
jgi:hypothetical protein